MLTKLIGKLVIFLVTAAVVAVALQFRRAATRRRLAALERGELCVKCLRPGVERIAASVRCPNCGHSIALSFLQSAKLTDGEITSMAKRDPP